jgi:hypothetical protein
MKITFFENQSWTQFLGIYIFIFLDKNVSAPLRGSSSRIEIV